MKLLKSELELIRFNIAKEFCSIISRELDSLESSYKAILDFKDNDKYITCDYAHYNDVVTKDEDLYPLAATALRRLEKLTSINKKVSSETINTIKQLKDPSQIADNIDNCWCCASHPLRLLLHDNSNNNNNNNMKSARMHNQIIK